MINTTTPADKAGGCKACQKYFSIATLAERFELSEKTIRRMITEGRLKAKRIRGSIRIPHTELAKIVRDY